MQRRKPSIAENAAMAVIGFGALILGGVLLSKTEKGKDVIDKSLEKAEKMLDKALDAAEDLKGEPAKLAREMAAKSVEVLEDRLSKLKEKIAKA